MPASSVTATESPNMTAGTDPGVARGRGGATGTTRAVNPLPLTVPDRAVPAGTTTRAAIRATATATMPAAGRTRPRLGPGRVGASGVAGVGARPVLRHRRIGRSTRIQLAAVAAAVAPRRSANRASPDR